MIVKGPKFLGSILVFCLLLSLSQVGWAKPTNIITLGEALDLAFRQNTSHSLYLWEQEILERREALKSHPQMTTEIKPIGVENGTLQKPEGKISLSLPLGENIDLSSSVSVKSNTEGLNVEPIASLSLNYDFFSLPKQQQEPVQIGEQQRQANGLVLQVVDLLIQVRKAADLKNYEEARLNYLETSLEAARQTPNFDDLPLRRALRDQVAQVAAKQEELDQLQLKLAALLGTAGNYDPLLEPKYLGSSFEEEDLQNELFSTNPSLRGAQENLVLAQSQLDLEQKTGGWDLKATGLVNQDLNWDVGLTASKTLYPRAIVLEELELAVAKAKHALEMQENSLKEELRRALQAITSAERGVALMEEHLMEAKADFNLRQKQYEAGLVTALQVEETRLSLQKAELDYFHAQLDYSRNVLELWNLCGRDLTVFVSDVIN